MTLWNFSNRTRNTQICVHIRECWYARIACNSFRWWCLNILINISSILWAGTRAGSFSRRRTPQCFRSAVICPSLFLFVAFSTTRLFSRACHVRLTLALTQKRHAIRRLCPFCAVANFFVLLFSYPCLFYGKKKKNWVRCAFLFFPSLRSHYPSTTWELVGQIIYVLDHTSEVGLRYMSYRSGKMTSFCRGMG